MLVLVNLDAASCQQMIAQLGTLDVAFERVRFADPTYVVDGVIRYCIANMPGGVPRTSTFALNNATLPSALTLADKGWKRALTDVRTFELGSTLRSARSRAGRSPKRWATNTSTRWR
jgi:alanine dehydrogenase